MELTPTEIMETFGIKQAAAYKWRKFLSDKNLACTKDNILALSKHIQEHGTYNGFQAVEESPVATTESSIVTTGETAIAETSPRTEAIAQTPDKNIGAADSESVPSTETKDGSSAANDLILASQQRAEALIRAEFRLAQHFINNPHLLPQESRDRIKQEESATVGKRDPDKLTEQYYSLGIAV